jgi:hypothetical protein
MKKTIHFLLAVFILMVPFSLSACSNDEPTNTQKEGIIMRIALCPSGGGSGSYLFEIYENGVLQCRMGTGVPEKFQSNTFLSDTVEQKEVQLREEDLQRVTALARELKASGYSQEKETWLDSWEVVLNYDGGVYEADYWHNPSSTFRELVNEVIERSLIPVDLQG